MLVQAIASFSQKLQAPFLKHPISVLQINLGKICNLACSHCHVEASPHRTEELTPEVCEQLMEIIRRFPQIQTVDLTGGAPEMLYGFRPLIEVAREQGKEAIARSNLTIYFEKGYEDIPEFYARHQVRVVASLPCYLEDNVDKMRGKGVFDRSIQALQWLNRLGYGSNPHLVLDLVYNSQLPTSEQFTLAPNQQNLEKDYKDYLQKHFGIVFNSLFALTNLPIGRSKFHLQHRQLERQYTSFLESHFNPNTLNHLMCRNQLSIDYQGNIYDCDFNQMENLPARSPSGNVLTLAEILKLDTLEIIQEIQTADYCYGCTAGSGSSCGGSLL
ncbi:MULTISPECIES: arsenosugar biosynthesis radical SAM (seleno)protein ArsS [Pseudanabaena]|uniref:Radical SAM domain protein n=2 Tax=Pseudanabaena TaxID=1152 RepID=L8N0K7_9CYAN|nr:MULTISPECIES: arsenosugar biosynthesis radical SAM (seleno)protein ArsS [Pseudanabaena]ELS32614.1 Radical SAM domain protein [Pseudanabaena biceps PCC 7429]MDG3495145.1 arsenosugar biosynthesis radical SAM protein ArsS [Pseudanabaena catenata USMAC16]